MERAVAPSSKGGLLLKKLPVFEHEIDGHVITAFAPNFDDIRYSQAHTGDSAQLTAVLTRVVRVDGQQISPEELDHFPMCLVTAIVNSISQIRIGAQ